jgi:hypothetical protein
MKSLTLATNPSDAASGCGADDPVVSRGLFRRGSGRGTTAGGTAALQSISIRARASDPAAAASGRAVFSQCPMRRACRGPVRVLAARLTSNAPATAPTIPPRAAPAISPLRCRDEPPCDRKGTEERWRSGLDGRKFMDPRATSKMHGSCQRGTRCATGGHAMRYAVIRSAVGTFRSGNLHGVPGRILRFTLPGRWCPGAICFFLSRA